MLASLGDYAFIVNSHDLATFSDLKFSNSAQFQEHKLLSRKSILEFTGLNASTCSLNIHLDCSLTVDMHSAIDYFKNSMNDGTALLFMIGEKVIGQGFWVIESIDESYPRISGEGELLIADLSLKLREYLADERDVYNDEP